MLEKLPRLTFVPGTPAIPYRPPQTICPPLPPGTPNNPGGSPNGGGYVQVCEVVQVFVGYDYGPASFGNPGPFPKAIYLDAGVVCRSEWRP